MTRSTIGVGHDGKSNAFARPGEATLATHHEPNLARLGDNAGAGLARAGAPKKLQPVSLHNGATEQQRKMTGMGHPVAGAPDASSANPLDPTVPGKRLTPPRASWGQGIDLLAEQGRHVVDQSIDRSNDSQHPAKLGRKS